MADVKVAVSIRYRWWVLPYLRLIVHLAYCGVRIDNGRVLDRLMTGVIAETHIA